MVTEEILTEQTGYPDLRLAQETAFFDALRRLNPGQLASLRRNAGTPIEQARNAAWFYRELDSSGFKNPGLYFLLATNFALDKQAINGSKFQSGNFGDSFALLSRREQASGNTERRFLILLDSHLEFDGTGEMAYRLRQSVRLLLSKFPDRSPIDWPKLLSDLKNWNWPNRRVQKQWAMHFYSVNTTDNANSK